MTKNVIVNSLTNLFILLCSADYYNVSAECAGSPTNCLGSGQRRDTDQGPFSLSTDGLDLTLSLACHNIIMKCNVPDIGRVTMYYNRVPTIRENQGKSGRILFFWKVRESQGI